MYNTRKLGSFIKSILIRRVHNHIDKPTLNLIRDFPWEVLGRNWNVIWSIHINTGKKKILYWFKCCTHERGNEEDKIISSIDELEVPILSNRGGWVIHIWFNGQRWIKSQVMVIVIRKIFWGKIEMSYTLLIVYGSIDVIL